MSIRENALKAQLKSEVIDMPEWGVKVLVKELTGKARYRFGAQMQDLKRAARAHAELVIACTFDPETGKPAFSEPDVEALESLSGSAINRISDTVIRISGIGPASVEEAEKNSPQATSPQSDGSPVISPGTSDAQ